jgi:predicted secreted hydrolase
VTRSSALAIALILAACSPSPSPGPSPGPIPIPIPNPIPPAIPPPTFLPANPDHPWSFPRDHFARPGYRTQWWYFTGLVTTAEGRRLGFQVTFFRVGLLPSPQPFDSAWSTSGAVMAHLAVTDLAAGRHRFAEVVWREAPLLAGFGAPPGPAVAFAQAPPGTAGRWTLDLDPSSAQAQAADGQGTWRVQARDDVEGLALALTLRPTAALVLQGPNGYSRKAAAPGFASEYYSQPRLAVEGTVSLDGRPAAVRGEAWMDREVGSSQLGPGQVGWDWFALRLADGRDLMLYVLRRADGEADWRNGTLVEPGGRVRYLGPEDWEVEATGRWRSPDGVDYPSGWRVRVPSAALELTVEPEVAGAENRSRLVRGLRYWEGPVRALRDGRPAGEGYVELAGRGAGSRLPL